MNPLTESANTWWQMGSDRAEKMNKLQLNTIT